MIELFALARKVAACDVTAFLITGETGTGKELLAQAIHQLSHHSAGPFATLSCAYPPDTPVDDELFGGGAFRGVDALCRGRFEAADGGTLFLDEIGDLPLALQARLLRVLQQRPKRPCYSRPMARKGDIRLICSTHENLEAMVREGTFREDLLNRLNILQLRMPALRDRRDDIAPLARHFLRRFASQFYKAVRQISPDALQALTAHDWPGNVRQLENVIQRAVFLTEAPTVELKHLSASISGSLSIWPPETDYEAEVREFKRRLVLRTLSECRGDKRRLARFPWRGPWNR